MPVDAQVRPRLVAEARLDRSWYARQPGQRHPRDGRVRQVRDQQGRRGVDDVLTLLQRLAARFRRSARALGLGREGLSVLQADLQKRDEEDERGLSEALARVGALGFLRHLDGALEKANVEAEGNVAWAAVSSEALGAPGPPLMLNGNPAFRSSLTKYSNPLP